MSEGFADSYYQQFANDHPSILFMPSKVCYLMFVPDRDRRSFHSARVI